MKDKITNDKEIRDEIIENFTKIINTRTDEIEFKDNTVTFVGGGHQCMLVIGASEAFTNDFEENMINKKYPMVFHWNNNGDLAVSFVRDKADAGIINYRMNPPEKEYLREISSTREHPNLWEQFLNIFFPPK